MSGPHGHPRLLRFALLTMAAVALTQLLGEAALLLDAFTWNGLLYGLRSKPLEVLCLLVVPMVAWALEASWRRERQQQRRDRPPQDDSP